MSRLEGWVVSSAARLGTDELVVLGVGILLVVGACLGLILSLSY
jgi:hypothetical protein